jgi:predicted RND superfamily exporter protein
MMKNAFFNRYGFRSLVIVFFLLPLIGQGTRRTVESNSNNVAHWLPDSFVETNQYQWFLQNFPFERFVVVSWDGCTMDDSRVEMFAQKLVPGQTIDNIGEWAEEHFRAELALEGEGTPEDQEPPEMSPLRPDVDLPTGSEAKPMRSPYFKGVLTGPRLVRMLKDRYSGRGVGGIKLTDETIHQKLRGILIGPDGHSTALFVTLTKEAPQGKELALVLEAIREVGRECGVHPQIQVDDRFFLIKASNAVLETVKEIVYGRNPRMNGVILGGPPVDNVAITKEGEETLQRLAGLCGLVGLTLAWLCFRDFRLTMFIFWMALISAGVALASVSFTGGTCDAILLSMPALVYVLAMSGAIHLINYYHDAILEHGLDMAPERAVRYAMYPCFFANFTTALGLLSLCMSGLIPISKFGFYSALGILLQLVLLFYYLPTLLHFYPSHKVAAQRSLNIETDSAMQKIWRVWSGFIIRNAAVTTVVCFSVMVFFGFGMTQIIPSVKMMRFFSSDSEIIHHYTWLEEHLGPLVPMEVVVQFDNEHLSDLGEDRSRMDTLNRLRLVGKICDALRSELADSVGGIMSAETMMPPPPSATDGRKSTNQIMLERGMNRMLDSGRSELRDFISFDGNLSLLTGKDRTQNLAQLGMTAEEADRLVMVGIDDVKKLIYTPTDAELAGISQEELAGVHKKAIEWSKTHGIDLWRVSLRVWSLKKDIDYAHFIQEVKDVVEPIIAEANEQLELETSPISAVYTGMVPVVYKTQHELYSGLAWSFVTSFVMIGIVLAFILGSPAAGFLAMVPNVFPVLIVFGFMGHFGILVDIGTMMTASVALGIATDDTIHFLTWFRHGIDEGMNRSDATKYAFSRCASAMIQTTLIAGFGLAAFALSTFTPTQMFGVMMLAILLTATFGDLVFLAAMLNTPLGRVFEPRRPPDISRVP